VFELPRDNKLFSNCTRPIPNVRIHHKIGKWNVRSMNIRKLKRVKKERENFAEISLVLVS
jgi:hypothetical protein